MEESHAMKYLKNMKLAQIDNAQVLCSICFNWYITVFCYLIYVYAVDNSHPDYISDSNGQRCVPDKNSENYNRGVTSQWCQDRSEQGYCSNPCKAIEQDLFTREDLLSDTNGLNIFDLHKNPF